MTESLPKIVSFVRFARVGFFDFVRLRNCVLSAMSKNLLCDPELPKQNAGTGATLGTFYHALMELAKIQTDETTFRQRVEDEIAQLQLKVTQERIVDRRGPVSSWREVNMYANAAHELFKRRGRGTPTAKTARKVETLITSSTSPLVGKPDLLEISGRLASLVDYKSSEMLLNDANKSELHREQCVYYSALIFEAYDVDLVAASIVSPYAEPKEWEITRQEASEYLDTAKKLVESANSKIDFARSVEDLATPNANTCSFCNKRIVCKPFLSQQFEMELDRPVRVVAGVLKSIRPVVGQTLLAEIQSGPRAEKIQVEVRRDAIEAVALGASIVISELQKRGSRLSCTRDSRVYFDQ